MSSKDIAVSVRGLSKSYTIAHNAPKHTMVGEALMHRLKHPFQKPEKETFWALKDVEFDIQKGDVVGIIGRNGAGKSTLLKILSRITKPTTGQIDLYGRVGSLLEVGTGFHPELTGRENIYLNGAILGMRKREIERQFDAIVDFAEVEQFLDTPVKRYSSGMYVRLAFAVAAHLNPEILIVDEVLAVGDAEFQKKCLGKMRDVSEQGGKTVLFVSHNMDAVRTLCSHGVVLRDGCVVCNDNIEKSISFYRHQGLHADSGVWNRPKGSLSVKSESQIETSGCLQVKQVIARLEGEQPQHDLCVQVDLESVIPHKPAFIAVDISSASSVPLMQAIPTIMPFIVPARIHHRLCLQINLPPLVPGRYFLTVWVGSHNTETLDEVRECVSFDIAQSPTLGRTYPHGESCGFMVPMSSVTYE